MSADSLTFVATGKPKRYANPAGRNKRTVWRIPSAPFPGSHFATFPPALVEPMIKAGTSERGCCAECGAPWRRVVERDRTFESGSGRAGHMPEGKNGHGLQGGGARALDIRRGPVVHTTTTGWTPTCTCPTTATVPCTVLDCFSGAATTGVVALRLGRRYVGIELNPEYIAMSHKRIAEDEGANQMHMALEA
jgi:hypothetical protein